MLQENDLLVYFFFFHYYGPKQTLVKIRVETQAMCLAQWVVSWRKTVFDLSSSASTSVLLKEYNNKLPLHLKTN